MSRKSATTHLINCMCSRVRLIESRRSVAPGYALIQSVAPGIPVPTYWIRLMCSVVGTRKADYILQTGTQVKSKDALAMGMVDQIVESRSEVLPAAAKELMKWLKLPDMGRCATKNELRHELGDAWTKGITEEASVVWDCISQKATSDFLGGVRAHGWPSIRC